MGLPHGGLYGYPPGCEIPKAVLQVCSGSRPRTRHELVLAEAGIHKGVDEGRRQILPRRVHCRTRGRTHIHQMRLVHLQQRMDTLPQCMAALLHHTQYLSLPFTFHAPCAASLLREGSTL